MIFTAILALTAMATSWLRFIVKRTWTTTRGFGGLKGLDIVQQELGSKIVYPVHPRAEKQPQTFNVEANRALSAEPLDYLSFLQLKSMLNLF
ncbi:MAG: hypothetical protein ACLFU9_07725 [Candidatus Bathyarchaeia archaeon]